MQGIMPPTDFLGIRPGDAVDGLRVEMIIELHVLKETIDRKKEGRDSGAVSGGDLYGKVSMKQDVREDRTYLTIPDHLRAFRILCQRDVA